MSSAIQAVRGMNDILPNEARIWRHVENKLIRVLERFGVEEIRLPIVESTGLFIRSIGDVTDIVEKEMYTFEDKGGDSLTLRPEGTAGCVRAAIERGMLYNQTQRLWYVGPMFRHERPQKGRYRQFYQLGVEAFGFAGPDIDAEIIAMTAMFWQELGLTDVTLELNSIGTLEDRARYRQALIAYYEASEGLDEDSLKRLYKNPLRILDSKVPATIEINKNAPSLMDYLSESSLAHFNNLRAYLDKMGIAYNVNTRLVRGLDYYTHTVFEWVTTRLGAQGTVCAGGRYDGLVEQLGGKPCPGFGFAMGLERIISLLFQEAEPAEQLSVDAYMIIFGDKAQAEGVALAHKIRAALPDWKILVNCGAGSIKSQFRKAEKSNAKFAFILGDEEVEKGVINVKNMRSQEQAQVTLRELKTTLENMRQAAEKLFKAHSASEGEPEPAQKNRTLDKGRD